MLIAVLPFVPANHSRIIHVCVGLTEPDVFISDRSISLTINKISTFSSIHMLVSVAHYMCFLVSLYVLARVTIFLLVLICAC